LDDRFTAANLDPALAQPGHLLPLPIPSHRSSRRPLRSDICQSPNFGGHLLIDVCHRLNLKFERLA